MSDPKFIKALEELIRREGSQEAAASALGLTQSMISRLLSGEREPSDETLEALGFRRYEVIEPIRK